MQHYGTKHLVTEDPFGTAPRLVRVLDQWLRVIAEQVACERAGLWLFDSSNDADRLRCLAYYETDGHPLPGAWQHDVATGGKRLFDALSGEALGLDSARSDALRGLSFNDASDSALRMASAFSLNGCMLGAFICSRPISGHGWSQRQLVTLTRASSTVALSLSRDGETAFDAFFKHQRGAST